MGRRLEKGKVGISADYVALSKATKKLQLNERGFRQLCIFKGIYPREPRHRIRAQRGNCRIRQLFLKQDITSLTHEPLIWKMRERKIHHRKYMALVGKGEKGDAEFYYKMKFPSFNLEHIVLERYPTFTDALADLDDPLCTCFLYGVLSNRIQVDGDLVHLCHRLVTEFMSFVIEARALRKAFVSLKGYYYRAHIQGHKVTWLVPHHFAPQSADFHKARVLKWFVEFYATMLNFVNYKLYQSLNLHYPPKLAFFKVSRTKNSSYKDDVNGAVEAMSIPLKTKVEKEDEHRLSKRLLGRRNDADMKEQGDAIETASQQVVLFSQKKFFLSRETNRESLTFVIRSAGGLVSWDKSVGPGATYSQDNKDILYEIVDRPTVEKKFLTRYYLQPQWVYDSFNHGILMPVQDYFVGVELPAHLSPFEETYLSTYKTPEELRVMALKKKVKLLGDRSTNLLPDAVASSDDDEADEQDEEKIQKGWKDVLLETEAIPRRKGDDEDDDDAAKGEEDSELAALAVIKEKAVKRTPKKSEGQWKAKKPEVEEGLLSMMAVKRGKPRLVDLEKKKRDQENEDTFLASKFIHRKQKRLYKKLLEKERRVAVRGMDMKTVRTLYEAEMLKKRRALANENAAAAKRSLRPRRDARNQVALRTAVRTRQLKTTARVAKRVKRKTKDRK